MVSLLAKAASKMDTLQSELLRNLSWKPWEWAIWILAFIAPMALPSQALLINEVAIMALFAVSLDLILGYTGIMSLGHAAFFGMGAFSAALLAKWLTPDPLLGLISAIVAATLLGTLCSLSILRGSDLTRIMVTLGVSLILLELANNLTWLTGGADGLQGVVMGPILGRFEFDLGGRTAAYYSLTVLLLFFLVLRRLVQSPFGATLKAIRDNRLRAAAIGISTESHIIAIYTIGAGIAGAAGGLLAQTTGFASLDVFAFERSADILLLVVIGGTGWLYGGVAGAIVLSVLHHILSDITPQYWTFWIGVFLVVLMRVGRERLIRPWTWFKDEQS
jgi:branched-chain amino acid transport system permease protein